MIPSQPAANYRCQFAPPRNKKLGREPQSMDLLNALAQFIVDAPGAKRRGGRLCCYGAVVQVYRTGEPFEECEAFQSWGGRVPISPCRNRFTNCLIA